MSDKIMKKIEKESRKDIKFYDNMAKKYIKKLKLWGEREQSFYDELADLLNKWI